LWAQPKDQDGKGLYLDFCGNCHGPAGRGGHVGKDIFGKTPGDIVDAARKGKGGVDYGNRAKYMAGMPARDLSDAELALINQFLHGK
jgi:mono/diheme cytochrome c family protein